MTKRPVKVGRWHIDLAIRTRKPAGGSVSGITDNAVLRARKHGRQGALMLSVHAVHPFCRASPPSPHHHLHLHPLPGICLNVQRRRGTHLDDRAPCTVTSMRGQHVAHKRVLEHNPTRPPHTKAVCVFSCEQALTPFPVVSGAATGVIGGIADLQYTRSCRCLNRHLHLRRRAKTGAGQSQHEDQGRAVHRSPGLLV